MIPVLNNPELVRLFEQIAVQVNPDRILEIGARQADFSYTMSSRLPDCRITCFEANPVSFDQFSLRFSNISNVEYLNLAVTDSNDPVQIRIPGGRDPENLTKGSASLLTRTNFPDADYTTFTVPGHRLDDLIQDGDRIVQWLDVEGHLESVFAGGLAVLGRTVALFLEVESRAFWTDQWTDLVVFEFLERHGFEMVAQDRESSEQYNVIFVRTELGI